MKALLWKTRAILVTFSAVAALTACTPATPTGSDTAAAPVESLPAEPAAPAPAPVSEPAPAPKPAPAPAPKPKVERTGPLLLNASFEGRNDDGAPKNWNIGNPDALAASTDASDGVHVLALESLEEDYAIVAQPVNLLPSDLGATLTITAAVLSPGAGQLSVDILYTVDGEKKSEAAAVPFSEEWQDVMISTVIPKDADPKSVRFRINLRPGAQGKYLVDNVRAALTATAS